VGVVDVADVTTTVEDTGTSAEDAAFVVLTTVAEGDALLGTAVGFPPLRQVQALEIFAGTLDHRAAYAGKV
jgi:hypothetical protein